MGTPIFSRFMGKINKKLNPNALTPRAKKLLAILEKSVLLVQYQKGWDKWADGSDKTFCNIMARDVLWNDPETLGIYDGYMGTLIDEPDFRYDISFIMVNHDPKMILNTPIPVAYKMAALAAKEGKIKELIPEEAQIRANQGTPIWITSIKYNHEAIVCPDPTPYDPERGVRIAQAGEHNGIMYISDPRTWGAWGKPGWTDPEIKYYEFPRIAQRGA